MKLFINYSEGEIMAIIIDSSFFIFKNRNIFLSEFPYDTGDEFDVVRFKYCKNRLDLPGFTCEEKLTAVTDLHQKSEEIWEKIDRTVRKKIRKAPKENIICKINENFGEFHSISKDFAKQKKFTSGIWAFLGRDIPTVKIMKKYGTLFTAELDGEILCGHLFLEDNENILGWMSTSKRLVVDKETSHLIGHATCLLNWEAINYAKEKSIGTFNWAGISSDPKKKSINDYKLSFGGQIVPTYFYSKINNNFYKKFSCLKLQIGNHRLRYSGEIKKIP